MIKKSIAGFLSCMFCLCFLDSVRVESAVIEPEIVKTETWTASYIVSDSEYTHEYPYVEVTAYIFNDGYVSVIGRNTHEWNGFRTYTQEVWMKQTVPYRTDSREYLLKTNEYCADMHTSYYLCKGDYLTFIDMSYYPYKYSEVTYSNNRVANWNSGIMRQSGAVHNYKYAYTYEENSRYGYEGYVAYPTSKMYLCDLEVDTVLFRYDFCPTEQIRYEEKFYLFGHDITITPELLSGNIVSQPELTEQEKYIEQLEEENAKLKTENEHYKETLNTDKDQIIKNLESEKEMLEDTLYQYKLIDYNGNGKLDVDDSQMILMYYVNTLAGKYTGTIEDYVVYRNDKAYESVHISGGN